MLVDPEIKKEINKEGFEGDAAVLIRKEEEGRKPRERLYAEGKAENLETYIKMHKEIVLPISARYSSEGTTVVSEQLEKNLLQNKGLVYFGGDGLDIYYIDKDGNVAKVVIDPTKISSLNEAFRDDIHWDGRKLDELIRQELKGLNMNEVNQYESLPVLIEDSIIEYNRDIQRKLKNKKKQEFDL